jgi:hypothetical protein
MAISRAKIYKSALSGFKVAGDLVFDAVLTRTTAGGYDPVTETTTLPTTITSSGQALFSTRNQTIGALLGGMVINPTDDTVYMRGLTFSPEPGDEVIIDTREYTVKFADDIVRAGALFLVVLA